MFDKLEEKLYNQITLRLFCYLFYPTSKIIVSGPYVIIENAPVTLSLYVVTTKMYVVIGSR